MPLEAPVTSATVLASIGFIGNSPLLLIRSPPLRVFPQSSLGRPFDRPRRERLAQARENRIGYARTTTLEENQWPRPVPGWIQPATDSLTQTHLSPSGFGPRQLQVRGGGHVGAATCPHVRGAWIATLAVIAGPLLETGEG
jgi:hypothetical protein